MEIKYELTKTPKEKPTGALGFGHIFTDHMFVDPAAMCLHYGQEVFEDH